MPDIRPSSELRNKYPEIEKTVRQTGGPVFITSRGRASMVLISHERYEELIGEKTVLDASEPTADELKQFGEVLHNLRDCKDLDMKAVSDKTGIGFDRLYMFESGTACPSTDELALLADVYGVKFGTLEYFIEPKTGRSRQFRNGLAEILNKIADVVD